jgi:hypothetical protein
MGYTNGYWLLAIGYWLLAIGLSRTYDAPLALTEGSLALGAAHSQ